MPVSRSDPRRATLIAVAALAASAAMVVGVLFLGTRGNDDKVTGSQAEFDAGDAVDMAKRIKDDGVPVLYQDPARFTRPIWVQHLGEDPNEGWLAFDAAVEGCATTWDRDTRRFTDCSGRHYPDGGEGLGRYLVTVEEGHVIVNLDPDAVTSTTTAPTTTTVIRTGG